MLSVTLKSHKSPERKSIQVPYVKYGTSIKTMIDNLNQFRGPDSQIVKLYNQFGQTIPNNLWNIQIKENIVFYTDMENPGSP